MVRKRWTPKTEINQTVINFREKRKWQIALRRYVIEKNKSSFYSTYFGLDIQKFRDWIELQFEEDLSWSSFGKAWQFDHIVPVAYFDFTSEEDLKLCWNFINISVERKEQNKNRGNRIDVIAAKPYFEELLQKTGSSICKKMVEKIEQIEMSQIAGNEKLEKFILKNREYIDILSGLTVDDYDKLNTGTELRALLAEKEFLKKWGS